MPSSTRKSLKLRNRRLRQLADSLQDGLKIEQLRFVARDRFGRHFFQQVCVVVTHPNLGMCRLKDDHLDRAISFQSHRQAIEVGEHLLTLDIDGRIIERDRKDAVALLCLKCSVAFVPHGLSFVRVIGVRTASTHKAAR